MHAITLLCQQDIAEIATFHQLCFEGDYFPLSVWEDLLSDPRTIVYAIRDNGRLVALLAVYNWQGEDNYVKIMTLCTHPDNRKRGMAYQLVQRMMKDMADKGMRVFKAETRVSNTPMQTLFDRLGFERTVRVENMMEHPVEDGYKYQRTL